MASDPTPPTGLDAGFTNHRTRLDTTPFAVLATHGRDGRLDLVPCCFAVDDEGPGRPELVTAIDHKPKSTQRLARLTNIERRPEVSLLLDHRDPDDWSNLWWIRAHGWARVVTEDGEHDRAVEALMAKYTHYRDRRPAGPAIRIAVERWVSWTP